MTEDPQFCQHKHLRSGTHPGNYICVDCDSSITPKAEIIQSKRYIMTGSEQVDRIVKPAGNGAHITVPTAWIGRNVAVVLLE